MVADLGSRVLIADRDASLRQQLYSRLLDLDLFSDCVSSGRDALGKLEERTYVVAVVDISLEGGGVDALQVLHRIAEIESARRPMVLVLADRPEAARTLDAEVVQIILRKPIELAQLAELVVSCARSAGRSRSSTVAVPPPADGDQLTS